MRRAIKYYLSTDRDLNTMVESVVGNWPIVLDAAIVDSDGNAILHSNPDLIGKPLPDRPDFQLVQNSSFRRQLRLIYHPPTVYDVSMPLELNGAPFGSIRVGISTVLAAQRSHPWPATRGGLFLFGHSAFSDAGRRTLPSRPGTARTDQPQPGSASPRERRKWSPRTPAATSTDWSR